MLTYDHKLGDNRGNTTNEQEFIERVEALRPPAVVMISAGAFTDYLAERFPKTVWIGRLWPDDNIHALMTPEQFVDRMATAYKSDRVVWYAGNEPGPPETALAVCTPEQRRMLWTTVHLSIHDWSLRACKLADKLPRRLCLLNHSNGTPESFVWPKYYLELLRHASAFGHLVGFHSYVNHGWGDWEKSYPWTIGRHGHILQTCQAEGFPCPGLVETETGDDSLDSAYKGHWAPAIGHSETSFAYELMAVSGLPEYQDPAVIGRCVFMHGNTGGWDLFDTYGRQTLERLLVENKIEPAPDPAPPAGEPVGCRPTAARIWRAWRGI